MLESTDQLWLLRIALLLHDIGKGGGRDHAAESVRIAREFNQRISLEAADAGTVEFLIAKHLLIPQALQSRDIFDPATADWLAGEIKTEEQLRLLVLMTFADISAVNPGAMTPWRAEQLVSVYHAVHRRLLGTLNPDGATGEEVYGELTPELRDFLNGLPARYLWTHTRETAQWHLDLCRRAGAEGTPVEIERRGGNWKLTVVAEDRPFLFASLAGGLASFGLNILKAEAFTNAAGWAVDTFTFSDPMRALELNPPEIERLRRLMARVAAGEVRVEELLRNRPDRKPPAESVRIAPRVGVDGEASSVATVFEITAQDRPGLLYALASAISGAGCNIEVVLVDTEAHKAIDVFHVTKDSRKLDAGLAASLRDALLAACR
jgi:[protein-PII] uridylyltransferase